MRLNRRERAGGMSQVFPLAGLNIVIGRFVPSSVPQTIEFGLWCWQGLHQSLPDKDLFHGVIPDGASRSGIIFPMCASA